MEHGRSILFALVKYVMFCFLCEVSVPESDLMQCWTFYLKGGENDSSLNELG